MNTFHLRSFQVNLSSCTMNEDFERNTLLEPKDDGQCYINNGEEELTCTGYQTNHRKLCTYYILGILSGFVIFLVAYWNPCQRVRFTHSRCPLQQAETVIVCNANGEKSVCRIESVSVSLEQADDYHSVISELIKTGTYRILIYQFLRFVWDETRKQFVPLNGLENNTQTALLTKVDNLISNNERKSLAELYGLNLIHVPIKSFFRIFIDLALTPFYFFQLFSCILWLTDDYTLLASFILVTSFISLFLSSYQVRDRLKYIRSMVSQTRQVKILKASDNSTEPDHTFIDSDILVPGDVVQIEEGQHLLFDAAIIAGTCIVDEALLTGESVPIHKTSVTELDCSNQIFSTSGHARQTLYNGTKVLQATTGKQSCHAIVISTGYATVKGRLIRRVLKIDPVKVVFFRDSLKFILLICAVAFCGFLYSVTILVKFGTPAGQIARRALDTITIAVSPALPIAITLGTLLASKRLKTFKIFCTEMGKITSSGKVKLVCFDKTGTLTESELKLTELIPIKNGDFINDTDDMVTPDSECTWQSLVKAMACCHSLSLISERVKGDPLDIELFAFTGARLLDEDKCSTIHDAVPVNCVMLDTPNGKSEKLSVLKQYLFESNLKRMGVVIASNDGTSIHAYVKGAPEVIKDLCSPDTVPANFDQFLNEITERGSRVIAFATKQIQLKTEISKERVRELSRDDVEVSMTFLGFAALQNVIKPESVRVVEELHRANIMITMATGDNIGTAVAVARNCNILDCHKQTIRLALDTDDNVVLINMSRNVGSTDEIGIEDMKEKYSYLLKAAPVIKQSNVSSSAYLEMLQCPQLVVDGPTLSKIRDEHPSLYQKVLVLGRVFARMTPNQKATLVTDLQSVGLTTCMCGDGANDCMALHASEVGISLSEAEASIAAPFTSAIQNISCVPILIREGRSALVTSFSCFKFTVLYSLIQFIGVLVLYSAKSLFTNNQFLFVDVVIGVTYTATIVQVRPHPILSNKRPPGKLFHPIFVAAVVGQLCIYVVFQVVVYSVIQRFSWYRPPETFTSRQGTLVTVCYENTVVFICASLQYIIAGFVSCQGPPFRAERYLDIRFSTLVLTTSAVFMFLTIHPGAAFQKMLNLACLPYVFTIVLLSILAANALIVYVFDIFFMSSTFKLMVNFLRRKKTARNLYKGIISDIFINKDNYLG